jgi:hypothetical protein
MTNKTLAELLIQVANPYKCVIKKEPRYHESWTDENTLNVVGVGTTYDPQQKEISIRIYKDEYGMDTQHWSGLNTQDRITFKEDTAEETILAQVRPFLQRHGFSSKIFFAKIKSQ